MTRRDELDRVLDGIEAAKEAGFAPVKINAVVERGVNDDEIVDLARFGRDNDVEVRFIEFMPLDAIGHWVNDQVVSQDEIVAAIAAGLPARAGAGSRRGAGRPVALPRRPRHGRRDPDRSPSRSAATATACASPPTASSAPACSRPPSSTCCELHARRRR